MSAANPLSTIMGDPNISFLDAIGNPTFTLPISTLSMDVFLIITELLDKKSLTLLEQTCKKLYQLVHDDRIWVDYLNKRVITVIPNKAKVQVLTHAKKCCSFLFTKIAQSKEDIAGQNIFDAKILINSRLPKHALEASCRKLIQEMNNLSYKAPKAGDNLLDLKRQLETKNNENELMLYADCDVSVEHATCLVREGAVSEATLIHVFKRIKEFTLTDVDTAICAQYSSDLIYLMLQKVKVFTPEGGLLLLERALTYTMDERVLLFLLKRVACTPQILETALLGGYSETLIYQMCEKLKEFPFTLSYPNDLIYRAFHPSYHCGKESKTVYTYSEDLICKILDRAEKINVRSLEEAQISKFSESNLKKFVEKVEVVTPEELIGSICRNISEELLLMMIPKLTGSVNIFSGFNNNYTEQVFQMLLDKNATVNKFALDKAIRWKFSENLIAKFVANMSEVTIFNISNAKKNGYSNEIIALLTAKCPNPPKNCIIS